MERKTIEEIDLTELYSHFNITIYDIIELIKKKLKEEKELWEDINSIAFIIYVTDTPINCDFTKIIILDERDEKRIEGCNNSQEIESLKNKAKKIIEIDEYEKLEILIF